MMGRACDGLVRLVLALIQYFKFMILSSPLLRSLVVNDYQYELYYLVVAQRYPVVTPSNVVVKPPSGVDTYVEESSNIETKY